MKKTHPEAKAKGKTVGVGIRLPAELWQEARMVALKRRIPAQEVVANALNAYLRRSKTE